MFSTVEPTKLHGPFNGYPSGATCQYQVDVDISVDQAVGIDTEIRWKRALLSSSLMKTCGSEHISASDGFQYTVLDRPSADSFILCSDSPFDELDEMLADDVKVSNLISFLRRKSTIQFASALSDRLSLLHEIVCEDPDEDPISFESLRSFIGFLQNTPDLRAPDIVLTPSNEIRAQWRTAPNRHFAVIFMPNGDARYVIFTPNHRDPDRIDRLSGITSVDSLMETARPHKVLDWASQ